MAAEATATYRNGLCPFVPEPIGTTVSGRTSSHAREAKRDHFSLALIVESGYNGHSGWVGWTLGGLAEAGCLFLLAVTAGAAANSKKKRQAPARLRQG